MKSKKQKNKNYTIGWQPFSAILLLLPTIFVFVFLTRTRDFDRVGYQTTFKSNNFAEVNRPVDMITYSRIIMPILNSRFSLLYFRTSMHKPCMCRLKSISFRFLPLSLSY